MKIEDLKELLGSQGNFWISPDWEILVIFNPDKMEFKKYVFKTPGEFHTLIDAGDNYVLNG